eukprot:GHVO01049559.1.p1 GENE.GHVO01049559.1~~GHVO01049559.1.p1  ORF type:complete len:879 (-),score=113.27 GHVO01049559.1:304-2940(-)
MNTSLMNASDVPLARFGHTTTYVGNYTVILFGGAVGDSGRYTITNDTFMLDLTTLKWSPVIAESTPSARAAHAAACVDSMQFVIYGGATGGGSLSTDELYLLDLRKHPNMCWMTVPITGETPGRRYGHTMVYHKPNLVVFGGNDGQRSVNDIWFMDVEKSPFSWTLVQLAAAGKQPLPRVYHSAEICKEGPANGMMVVFGGRTTEGSSLRDAWGLRQHRDGRWDWVEAPTKKGTPPDARFQHSALFLGCKMIVIGGRDGEVTRPLPTGVYDTEACEWRVLPSMGRFRHSSWAFEQIIYTFGGFDHRTQARPTADLQSLDVRNQPGFFSEKEREQLEVQGIVFPKAPPPISYPNPVERKNAAMSTSTDAVPRGTGTNLAQEPPNRPQHPPLAPSPLSSAPNRMQGPSASSSVGVAPSPDQSSMIPAQSQTSSYLSQAKLHKTVHATYDDFSTMVHLISIETLEDEGRKIKGFESVSQGASAFASNSQQAESQDTLYDRVIRKLLRPNVTQHFMDREFNPQGSFSLCWEDVAALCNAVLSIVSNEPMVLKLRPPIKVYGDIHGQYYDMMRLFASYKSPVGEDWLDTNAPANVSDTGFPSNGGLIAGDIDSNDYLFLGDFVDRGTNSLEVICLLFALKCKYPRQIHLIRGNHEDSAINSIYGFKDECKRRLREDPDHIESCWERFNRVFEWLPVGATIEDRILCIHGGIGGSIHTIQHIAELKRPLKVSQVPMNEIEQRVTDLLWSDPTDNDSLRGVMRNDTRDPDGSGHIVKYGPDRVISFLKANKFDLIIRAHECVMDGFERFAGGKLITLFSATDYCGHHKNAGALLFIRRDLTVVPKIIYPAERDAVNLRSTWISLDSRPPTPPRSGRRARETDLGF